MRSRATLAATATVATLLPMSALAHGVHVAPLDGHSHGVLPYLIGAAVVGAVGLFVLARRR